MRHVASIGDLGVPAATRPRGREAVQKFRQRWPAGDLAVSLDGVSLLSLSFLDELITGLAAGGDLARVVFVTDEPRTMEKLARVAFLHPEVQIRARGSHESQDESVAPRPFDPQAPIVEQAKPDPDDDPSLPA